MTRRFLPIALVLLFAATARGQVDRDMNPTRVRAAMVAGLDGLGAAEERWRATLAEVPESERSWAELFGYNPPGTALTLAYLASFLWELEGDAVDAELAANLLARMAAYRDEVPDALRGARVEYADGLPAVPSFFHLADYAEAYDRIRGAPLDPDVRRSIEAAIESSADFVFAFPEWGAHNRALLRAESLAWAARALPESERAADYRRMAQILAADSLHAWEIEDAQIYHPIWLLALFRYAEVTGTEGVVESVQARYYLRYLLELLTPRGTLPDFGDGWWNGGLARAYACLEWGAAELGDPELRWGAARVWNAIGPPAGGRPDLGRAKLYAWLHGHVDPSLEPREPALALGACDDVIGKKLVLRDGWGADDFYLLLNYRDEGDWGRLQRDFLRQTLAVEEEKAHHGHSDEGSIVLFMDAGSVLLHDAGYRERAPSGPYGAWRADVFHNRLVARPGAPAPGQDMWEFLRDSGRYRPTRAERIDFLGFEGATYARTRVTAEEPAHAWDRVLVRPSGTSLVIVVDVVESTAAAELTLATLWATQEIEELGPEYAVGRYRSIEQDALPANRALLVVFPGTAGAEPAHFALRRHRQDESVLYRRASRELGAGERVALVSVLWPVAPGADAAGRAAGVRIVDSSPGAVGVEVELDERTFTALVKLDLHQDLGPDGARPSYDPERGRNAGGPLATDADFAFASRAGARTDWGASNMTFVDVDGERVFAARPFQVFQTGGRADVVGRAKWRRWEGTAERE